MQTTWYDLEFEDQLEYSIWEERYLNEIFIDSSSNGFILYEIRSYREGLELRRANIVKSKLVEMEKELYKKYGSDYYTN